MSLFRNRLRRIILDALLPGEEQQLKSTVRVGNNSMIGYGDICAVFRQGKRGNARCYDLFGNVYYLSELSEDQCNAIIDAL